MLPQVLPGATTGSRCSAPEGACLPRRWASLHWSQEALLPALPVKGQGMLENPWVSPAPLEGPLATREAVHWSPAPRCPSPHKPPVLPAAEPLAGHLRPCRASAMRTAHPGWGTRPWNARQAQAPPSNSPWAQWLLLPTATGHLGGRHGALLHILCLEFLRHPFSFLNNNT